MKLAYQTNTWGGVFGHPAGVTSINKLYYLANGSTEVAISEIAEAGYKGIELFDGNLMQYQDNPEEFKTILKNKNISFVGVYVGANFIYKEILEEELIRFETVCKLAAQLEAEQLVVGGGAIRANGPKDEDYKLLAEGLDAVTELAEKYNLIASYHPHLGTIGQSPEQLDKIMSLTKINLCPDTAHIVAGGGDALEVVKKYINRIKYIHFKDYKDGAFLPLGEGEIDFIPILKVFKEASYKGWVTVELDSHDNPKKGAEISFQYLEQAI